MTWTRTRLSKRSEKGGGLGMLEIRDNDGLTAFKILRLADLVKNSRSVSPNRQNTSLSRAVPPCHSSSSVLPVSLPKWSISMVQVGGDVPALETVNPFGTRVVSLSKVKYFDVSV